MPPAAGECTVLPWAPDLPCPRAFFYERRKRNFVEISQLRRNGGIVNPQGKVYKASTALVMKENTCTALMVYGPGTQPPEPSTALVAYAPYDEAVLLQMSFLTWVTCPPSTALVVYKPTPLVVYEPPEPSTALVVPRQSSWLSNPYMVCDMKENTCTVLVPYNAATAFENGVCQPAICMMEKTAQCMNLESLVTPYNAAENHRYWMQL